MNIKKELASMANTLDAKGFHKEADAIDGILIKLSQSLDNTKVGPWLNTPVGRMMSMWFRKIKSAKAVADKISKMPGMPEDIAKEIYPESIVEQLTRSIRELVRPEDDPERQEIIRDFYDDFSEDDIKEFIERLITLLSDVKNEWYRPSSTKREEVDININTEDEDI